MSLLSILGNVASGGLLGILGQVAVGFLETWRADKESKRKIEEMKALSSIRVEESTWAAFGEAQKSAAAPDNAPPWAAAVITLTRPALTLLLVLFAAYVYISAVPEVRADMSGEITACAFGAVWFWFGSRYQSRVRSK